VYVGRNVAHHNKQAGFWSKQATDVIFSQNEAYEHRPSDSSEGQCMGFQYAPEYVWFLFNRVHDCNFGINIVGDGGDTGQNTFLIGNVIYAIHGPGNAGDSYAPAAIHIHDSDAGVESPENHGFMYMVNNVISQPTKAGASHVFIETAAMANAAGTQLHHNLFGGGARIRWKGSTYTTLASFIAANPTKGAASSEAVPAFVDAAAKNFALASGSAGIDVGSADPVYDAFTARYPGLSIARDFVGQPRPVGSSWDMGAYETLLVR
jgi:hypothetical protein